MKQLSYQHTVRACYLGYTTQSAACNFAPLLFVTLHQQFQISYSKITFLITVTFFVQLAVDLVSAGFVDRVGYRKCLISAHIFAAAGFISLGILPFITNPYAGIMISVILYSMGSGLLEVLVSPVVESCPMQNKSGSMSLLHSFYCWGSVFTILISTLFFVCFGREKWWILSIFWSVLPILNAVYFSRVPIYEPEKEMRSSPGSLFSNKVFWKMFLIMIMAGASELAMSQWASVFAETALGVNKTVGDIAGPCMFAVFMGTGRVLYSVLSSIIDLKKYLLFNAGLCIISYLICTFSDNDVFALVGCALCGFSVAVMWPGAISMSAGNIPNASTAMFAMLAFAGDIGCTAGPTVLGVAADSAGSLRSGFLLAAVFPLILLAVLLTIKNGSGRPVQCQNTD